MIRWTSRHMRNLQRRGAPREVRSNILRGITRSGTIADLLKPSSGDFIVDDDGKGYQDMGEDDYWDRRDDDDGDGDGEEGGGDEEEAGAGKKRPKKADDKGKGERRMGHHAKT